MSGKVTKGGEEGLRDPEGEKDMGEIQSQF